MGVEEVAVTDFTRRRYNSTPAVNAKILYVFSFLVFTNQLFVYVFSFQFIEE